MFTTTGLGYAYATLPAVPPQQMREAPTLAVFEVRGSHELHWYKPLTRRGLFLYGISLL